MNYICAVENVKKIVQNGPPKSILKKATAESRECPARRKVRWADESEGGKLEKYHEMDKWFHMYTNSYRNQAVGCLPKFCDGPMADSNPVWNPDQAAPLFSLLLPRSQNACPPGTGRSSNSTRCSRYPVFGKVKRKSRRSRSKSRQQAANTRVEIRDGAAAFSIPLLDHRAEVDESKADIDHRPAAACLMALAVFM